PTPAKASVKPPASASMPPRRSAIPMPTFALDGVPPARRKDVQRLLELGITRGFLTYDEVNEALTPEMVTSEQLDDLMLLFSQQQIEVGVAASQASKDSQRPSIQNRTRVSEPPPRTSQYPSVPPSALDENEMSKSSDPVRMYLRKMGSVSL